MTALPVSGWFFVAVVAVCGCGSRGAGNHIETTSRSEVAARNAAAVRKEYAFFFTEPFSAHRNETPGRQSNKSPAKRCLHNEPTPRAAVRKNVAGKSRTNEPHTCNSRTGSSPGSGVASGLRTRPETVGVRKPRTTSLTRRSGGRCCDVSVQLDLDALAKGQLNAIKSKIMTPAGALQT